MISGHALSGLHLTWSFQPRLRSDVWWFQSPKLNCRVRGSRTRGFEKPL